MYFFYSLLTQHLIFAYGVTGTIGDPGDNEKGSKRCGLKELRGEKQHDTKIHATLESIKVTSHYCTSLALSTNVLHRLYYLHFTSEDPEAWSSYRTSLGSHSSKWQSLNLETVVGLQTVVDSIENW